MRPPLPPFHPRADRLMGGIAAVLLVLGLWQGIAALTLPQSRLRLGQQLTVSSILSGNTAAAINQIMSHYLPADLLLRASGGLLRWGLFRSGGPQVGVGCNDWLFLAEELRPWPDGAVAMRRRADLVQRVAVRLQAKGIVLRVVVVPDKARVEGRALCGLRYAAQAQVRYGAFAALLDERGVTRVDLLQSFEAARRTGSPLYLRTDTHWNQRGAALAASLVAEQAGIELGTTHFRTEAAGPPAEHAGDLLRLMSLNQVPDRIGVALRPAPDLETPERTVALDAPVPAGLLDEAPEVEAVLVGSSFSANGNFHGQLQQALRMPVISFARPGGGFAGAAGEYLVGPAFRESPPKLMIWEFPERVVGQPLGEDEAKLLVETGQPDATDK